MARKPRKRSESGVYHIVLRGVNRQDIFYEDDDYQHFLKTLAQMKSENQYLVYGYCLMSNHIHLLIKENTDNISRIMSRIGTSYAWWYNRKYNRTGHVFQGRYRSECVEDDSYLLTVIRYIHNNPIQAGLVQEAQQYQWSSIHAYYGEKKSPDDLTESSFILNIINEDLDTARLSFRNFMDTDNDDNCLDDQLKFRKTDQEVKTEIEALMNGEPIGRLLSMERLLRNEIIRRVKQSEGTSLRQIARVTGLSVDVVYKA